MKLFLETRSPRFLPAACAVGSVILEIQRAPPTRVRPHARERAWVDCDTNDACDDGIPGTSGDQHCTRACESCRAR